MLSIIIPTYNEEENIGRLLDALNAQIKGDDEIIIVDSYSKDKTVDIAQEKGVKVILQPKLGIGLAKTEGGKNAKNGLLVMLDADAVPCQDYLERIRNHFSDEKLVALCGLGLYYSNSGFWKMIYNSFAILVFWFGRITHFLTGKYWLPANNCVIRKDVFFSVGGYRSVICEDNDLMKRLPGSRNVKYDPKLLITLSDRRFRQGGFFRTVGLWLVADAKAWLGIGKDAKDYRN